MTLPDPEKTHFVWSISKDLALNGLRVGVFVSQNTTMVNAMRYFAIFSNISSLSDFSLQSLLSDKEWIDGFIQENQVRLASNYEKIVSYLKEKNIEFIPASAGFFIWIKLKGIQNQQEEFQIWTEIMNQNVLILPGHAFHSQEYGWFRILFSLPWNLVKMGLDRVFSLNKFV